MITTAEFLLLHDLTFQLLFSGHFIHNLNVVIFLYVCDIWFFTYWNGFLNSWNWIEMLKSVSDSGLNCSMLKMCCQVGYFNSLKTNIFYYMNSELNLSSLSFVTSSLKCKCGSWNFQAVQRQVSELLLAITSVLYQFLLLLYEVKTGPYRKDPKKSWSETASEIHCLSRNSDFYVVEWKVESI